MPRVTKVPPDAHRSQANPDAPLFAEPSQPTIPRNAPQEISHVPLLQWASGHTEARSGGSRFTPFVGFHSEVGKDLLLDGACEAAGTPKIDIRHPRSGGSPEIKAHWAFGETVDFFPLTAGPPARTISACVRQFPRATAEAGIGLSWPAGGKSRMAVRGYLKIGATLALLQLTTRSTMTNALLHALLQHLTNCETADTLIDRSLHPTPVGCYELAMCLVADQEVSVGGNETTQITPFRAMPIEATKEALRSHWRPAALARMANEDWPAVQAWAAGYASGETNGDSHLGEE